MNMIEVFGWLASLSFTAKIFISAATLFFYLGFLAMLWMPPKNVVQKSGSPNASPVTIEQQTQGHNSPVVVVGEGDVNINSDQRRDKK